MLYRRGHALIPTFKAWKNIQLSSPARWAIGHPKKIRVLVGRHNDLIVTFDCLNTVYISLKYSHREMGYFLWNFSGKVISAKKTISPFVIPPDGIMSKKENCCACFGVYSPAHFGWLTSCLGKETYNDFGNGRAAVFGDLDSNWVTHPLKHRKNCECCPVSQLIVRQQRLSLIQVLNCQYYNEFRKVGR